MVSRIGGGPPAPGLTPFLIFWLLFGAAPLLAGIFLLQSEPAHRRFWWRVLLGVLLLFLVVGADGNLGPRSWHHLLRGEKFPGTDADALTHTLVTAHLGAEISKGRNLLWCGTFQLAWNEACRLTGGDLQFQKEHSMIAALNKHSFTKESLDEPSYVAMAGFVKEDIHEKIRKAVEVKFRGVFKPRFIPDKGLTPRPQDFVAYACLYKKLSFAIPFERPEEELRFRGVLVPAFGLGPYKPSLKKVYAQVSILDYQSEADFIIELKTQSDSDRLILAKVQPESNLADTLTSVGKRVVTGQVESAVTNDILLVPRIKLDLTRRYSELEGLRLVPQASGVAKDLVLMSAVQNTKFEMNERGAELESEAHMAFACDKQRDPIPKHRMIFDKPFLILMQRRDGKTPYFAFWVENPEALVSWR